MIDADKLRALDEAATEGPWEFDAKDGYIFFRPNPLTRYVVAELQSGDDRYGHFIVEAVNEKIDREIDTVILSLAEENAALRHDIGRHIAALSEEAEENKRLREALDAWKATQC
jgi:hypothetical protein